MFKQPVCDLAARNLGEDVAALLAAAYRQMGYDALNIGEMELGLGVDFLLRLQKKAGFPFICSNLLDRKNQPVFPPYLIKDYTHFRVGIFGLLPSRLVDPPPQSSIRDPFQSAAQMVLELKKQANLIICLSNLGLSEDQKLAQAVPGIDVIIGGRTNVLLEHPWEQGHTLILQAAEKGEYLGEFEARSALAGSKERIHWQYCNRLVPLDEKIAEDPEIKGMINRFKDKYDPLFQRPFLSAPKEVGITHQTLPGR